MSSAWSKTWTMPLNYTKLAHQLIGSRYPKHSYVCNRQIIQTVTDYKDLGILITSQLFFCDHVSNITRKAHGLCSAVFRTFSIRNPAVLSRLFITILRPPLEYASQVWSFQFMVDSNAVARVQQVLTK